MFRSSDVMTVGLGALSSTRSAFVTNLERGLRRNLAGEPW